ncbi:MAG: hypothetical protein ACOC7N_01000 [Chloroflexota bacterium]
MSSRFIVKLKNWATDRRAFIAVNTLSASLFGLASYGLLGLWMCPRRSGEGLPAALLLLGLAGAILLGYAYRRRLSPRHALIG